MKQLVFLASALCLTLGAANAQNLLVNGDFSLDDGVSSLNALGWTEYNSAWDTDPNAWVNRETQNITQNPPYGDTNDFHYAMGYYGGYGASVSQDVTVTDDGSTFQLTADSSLDVWWMNSGYLKIEFYDAGATTLLGEVESAHWSQPGYDTGVPWANYSVAGVAPAGTETVRAILGSYGEGGTARFDNAVLVIPEPTTGAFLALGSLMLLGYRSRRNATRA